MSMKKKEFVPYERPAALSRIDAARYIGVSLRTLDELMRVGKLERVKIGAKVVLRFETLDAYLSANEAPAR